MNDFDFLEGTWNVRNRRLVKPLTGSDAPPMLGGFDGDRGEFYADDAHEGTPVRCRFIWTVHGPDACRWEQAFSVDGERTWETNWTMDFTRA